MEDNNSNIPNYLADQKIIRLLWKLEFHKRAKKSQKFESIISL